MQWLNRLKSNSASTLNYEAVVDLELDNLADGLEASLDIDALLNDAATPRFSQS